MAFQQANLEVAGVEECAPIGAVIMNGTNKSISYGRLLVPAGCSAGLPSVLCKTV